MKTIRLAALCVAIATLGACASIALADSQEAKPAGVRAEMLMWIGDAQQKLIELAEATPEEKYAWRPNKDVRSTGEVFMHVVTANYGLPSLIGVTPPEGFDFNTYEKSKTKKADIVQALKDSFAHVNGALGKASDADLEKAAKFFGLETTSRGAYMLVLAHAHEHLGQSIAYARMNGITPPWTARQEAQAKKAAEKTADKK